MSLLKRLTRRVIAPTVLTAAALTGGAEVVETVVTPAVAEAAGNPDYVSACHYENGIVLRSGAGYRCRYANRNLTSTCVSLEMWLRHLPGSYAQWVCVAAANGYWFN